MASQLELVNMALAEVAEVAPLSDINEDSTPARLARLHYDQAIREVLREGMWKAARTSAVLAQISPAPTFGWGYAYQLPNDFLRIVSFNDIDPDDVREELFEIRGDQLHTDETVAKVVYVRDLTIAQGDINAMDALLTKAAILNLATKLAWPLQQSRTLQENLELRYREALRRAKSADARDEFRPTVNRLSSSRWQGARFGSTAG